MRLRRDRRPHLAGYLPGSKAARRALKDVYGVGAGMLREALPRLVSDALIATEGHAGFA
nr:GntR family transcriptional regulator [Burkholderia cenocepacia]